MRCTDARCGNRRIFRKSIKRFPLCPLLSFSFVVRNDLHEQDKEFLHNLILNCQFFHHRQHNRVRHRLIFQRFLQFRNPRLQVHLQTPPVDRLIENDRVFMQHRPDEPAVRRDVMRHFGAVISVDRDQFHQNLFVEFGALRRAGDEHAHHLEDEGEVVGEAVVDDALSDCVFEVSFEMLH